MQPAQRVIKAARVHKVFKGKRVTLALKVFKVILGLLEHKVKKETQVPLGHKVNKEKKVPPAHKGYKGKRVLLVHKVNREAAYGKDYGLIAIPTLAEIKCSGTTNHGN